MNLYIKENKIETEDKLSVLSQVGEMVVMEIILM